MGWEADNSCVARGVLRQVIQALRKMATETLLQGPAEALHKSGWLGPLSLNFYKPSILTGPLRGP